MFSLFTGWRRGQDLRDSDRAKKYTWYDFRNWNNLNGHSYQICWEKNPLTHPFTFNLNLSRKKVVKLHVDFFGLRLFYNFADVEGRSYGLSYYSEAPALVIHWGYGSGFNMGPEGGFNKFIYMPWAWERVENKIIAKNGKWIDSIDWKLDELVTKVEEFPYEYKLRNGEIQNRIAKVSVDRMIWRWRIFRKLKYFGPKLDRTLINVEFNDEVGERTGSWKCGCIGCSYEMKKGETPEQTLKRMELERIFD